MDHDVIEKRAMALTVVCECGTELFAGTDGRSSLPGASR
jgi:hypothetical protein